MKRVGERQKVDYTIFLICLLQRMYII